MGEHEEQLGYTLKCRLTNYLSEAHRVVIPPGTLGAGMGFNQSDDVAHEYDAERDVLVIKGTTTITVYRNDDQGSQ